MTSSLTKWQTLDVHLRSPLQMRQYSQIADRVAASAPGRVLDWGCGRGQVTALLRERGVDVTSFEWSADAPPEGAEIRLQDFPDVVAQISSDPVKLPYADASFDTALSVGVLEHVPDPGGSLDELARVLKPGGRLHIANLPNRYSWTERVAKLIGAYYHGKLPHDKVYTQRTARELLQRHGYTVYDERMTGMIPQIVPIPLPAWSVGPLWKLNEGLAHVPGLKHLATAVELTGRRP